MSQVGQCLPHPWIRKAKQVMSRTRNLSIIKETKKDERTKELMDLTAKVTLGPFNQYFLYLEDASFSYILSFLENFIILQHIVWCKLLGWHIYNYINWKQIINIDLTSYLALYLSTGYPWKHLQEKKKKEYIF